MKLPQLTFTRFIGAITVVIIHFLSSKLSAALPALGGTFHNLSSLVSYFFILSGFILVVSSAPQGKSLNQRQFWLNRFARVYPLYLFACLLTVIVFIVLDNFTLPTVNGSFSQPVIASLLLLQAWVPDFSYSLNYPSWSLSVEALLYLLFPFLFRALLTTRTTHLLLLSISTWVINQIVHYKLHELKVDERFANAFPIFHIATFVMGVCLGILFVRHVDFLTHHKRYVNIGFWITVLVYSYWMLTDSVIIRHNETGAFAPLYAACVLVLSVQTNWLTRLFSRPVLVYLGELSYGIYILQAPLYMIFHSVNKNYFHFNTLAGFPFFVATLLILSACCFEWIEKPGRIWLKQLTAKSPSASEIKLSSASIEPQKNINL